jgi:sugar lactone lactonase YvrE
MSYIRAAGRCSSPTTNNNRVLIWNTPPIDLSQSAAGRRALSTRHDDEHRSRIAQLSETLTGPNSIHVDASGGRLYVSDPGNHRILYWKCDLYAKPAGRR